MNEQVIEQTQQIDEPIVVCENLVKIYKTSEIEVVALQGLDLTINRGELMAIIGNSGSGKSTLLNMLGCLDVPSAGNLYVDGKNIQKLSKKEILEYKRETVGFVWQNNARNLIPYLTAKENIEMPNKLSGIPPHFKPEELLEMVGLSHRMNSRLFELSGGEQQRVAIAIAISNNPKIILADEPTGAVDTKTTRQILDVFKSLNKQLGLTVIIVTHDRLLTKLVDRIVFIQDGKISSEMLRRSYSEEMEELAEGNYSLVNTHEEFSIIDKSNRIHIPADFTDVLHIRSGDKVKIELKDNQIVLTKPEE